MGDWAGWLLALTLVLPLLSETLYRNWRVAVAYVLVVALHLTVTLFETYVDFTLAGGEDALNFERGARHIARYGGWEFGLGSHFYVQFIGFWYWLFGPSRFLSGVMSVATFAMAAIVFVKFMALLQIDRHRALVLMLFGAWPSVVMFTSITLRESYQLLFFMLALYFAAGAMLEKQPRRIVYVVLASLGMAVWHKGLVFYAVVLIALVVFMQLTERRQGPAMKVIAAAFGVALVGTSYLAIGSVSTDVPGMDAVTALQRGEALSVAEEYRETARDSRATYRVSLETGDPVSFAVTSTEVFVYYMFAPFPWQVTSLMDAYASVEGMLRGVLLTLGIIAWRRARGGERNVMLMLLLGYLSIAFLWAVGTSNYGTAIRHHAVHSWILALTGGPILFSLLQANLPGQKRTPRQRATPLFPAPGGRALGRPR